MVKVRVGRKYTYEPVPYDKIHPPMGVESGELAEGDTVKVVNLHGCPKANTMGMCYIGTPDADFRGPNSEKIGTFLGMVFTSSLRRINRMNKVK